MTAEYKVLQPRLLLYTCFFYFMVIYGTSVIKTRDQQMGQNRRLVLFSFIYFFLLSFFLCYQENDSSGEASEVYLKAPLSNLAPDSFRVSVILNTFTAIVDLSRFNNSCLKLPASTLVHLTFQSRALRQPTLPLSIRINTG